MSKVLLGSATIDERGRASGEKLEIRQEKN